MYAQGEVRTLAEQLRAVLGLVESGMVEPAGLARPRSLMKRAEQVELTY